MPRTWRAHLSELLVSGWRWRMQLLTMAVFGLSLALTKVCFQSVRDYDNIADMMMLTTTTTQSRIADFASRTTHYLPP